MSLKNCKIVTRRPLMVRDAKWVSLVKTTYSDPHGTTREWESAERTTRPPEATLDGVGILAILSSATTPPSLLLQKQFRPPVGQITIEIPAGLIDADESSEQCALRELHEETGYIGDVLTGDGALSCLMYNDPGMCNTNTVLVHVAIDLERPENQNPQPKLDENEFIESFMVPLTNLYQECKRLEKEGCAIDARVGTLAEGIEIAKKWGLRA